MKFNYTNEIQGGRIYTHKMYFIFNQRNDLNVSFSDIFNSTFMVYKRSNKGSYILFKS